MRSHAGLVCEPMLRFRALVMPDGQENIKDAVSRTAWLGEMLNSGYAAIVVDRLGTGASFGQFTGESEAVAREMVANRLREVCYFVYHKRLAGKGWHPRQL